MGLPQGFRGEGRLHLSVPEPEAEMRTQVQEVEMEGDPQTQ